MRDTLPVGGTPQGGERSLGLDLIRAAAIVLVLVGHWSNNILQWFGVHAPQMVFVSGDLGVQLFFGLSGFLIGTILIDQARADPSWRNFGVFMVRRWMRTLPLYFAVLGVLLILYPPHRDAGHQALLFATMTQNLFGPMPDWFPVTWSLAVEEWFYLLFGASAFAAARLIRRPWAMWIPTAVFLVVPLYLRLVTPGFDNWAGGLPKMTVFRLDAIAYGVALAQVYRQRSLLFEHPRVSLACGLVLIALGITGRVPGPALFPATTYSFVMLGCVLLIPPALKLRRLPRSLVTPIQALSNWSYCIYLVHMTLLVEVAQSFWWRKMLPAWACVPIAVLAPFVVAWLSFRFLEQPILRLRPRHGRAGAVLAVAGPDTFGPVKA